MIQLMNDRFPKDCWDKKCQHFHVREISIDDLRCTCDLLYGECDASDEEFSVARCPRADTVDQCDLCSAPWNPKYSPRIKETSAGCLACTCHGCVHLHACKLQCGGTRIHNDT